MLEVIPPLHCPISHLPDSLVIFIEILFVVVVPLSEELNFRQSAFKGRKQWTMIVKYITS
jgi:hypothetical protein